MSKLEELLAELCPDGVEYVELCDVAHYAKRRIDAREVDESTYVGVENLLQNKMGKTSASTVPATGNVIAFEKGNKRGLNSFFSVFSAIIGVCIS